MCVKASSPRPYQPLNLRKREEGGKQKKNPGEIVCLFTLFAHCISVVVQVQLCAKRCANMFFDCVRVVCITLKAWEIKGAFLELHFFSLFSSSFSSFFHPSPICRYRRCIQVRAAADPDARSLSVFSSWTHIV